MRNEKWGVDRGDLYYIGPNLRLTGFTGDTGDLSHNAQ